jgi:hypothetical protein
MYKRPVLLQFGGEANFAKKLHQSHHAAKGHDRPCCAAQKNWIFGEGGRNKGGIVLCKG